MRSHGLSSQNRSREQKCRVRGQLRLHLRDGDTGEWPEPLPGEGQASCNSQVSVNCPFQSSSQKVLYMQKGALYEITWALGETLSTFDDG